MSGNRNGFVDALNRLNTVANINQNVDLEVLEEVATFFANKLKDAIPLGIGTSHLKNEIKVVIQRDMVQVTFSKKAWYWHLADKGHKKANGSGRVKGLHFTRNTVDAYGQKVADMMAEKIIEKMEG